MPRIRTLKPDHRLHRKVGPLSHIGYRLWVAMILEADDEGRLFCAAEQLRALAFGYHPEVTAMVIERELDALASVGLIQLYEVDAARYAWFPSWHDHQRIDKKQPSRLPAYEHSKNVRLTFQERSRLKGREGKGREVEGKGLEGNGKEGKGVPLPGPVVPGVLTAPAWEGYRAAYQRRYGTDPVRNAKVNGQLAHLLKRIPADEAPEVAAFYVAHSAALYVRAGHPVDLLLRDAEKLRTEWVTGHRITETKARQDDQRQNTGDIAHRLLEKAERQAEEARRAES